MRENCKGSPYDGRQGIAKMSIGDLEFLL